MSGWRNQSNLTEPQICEECKLRPCQSTYTPGRSKWKRQCGPCVYKKYNKKFIEKRQAKKLKPCSFCNFMPIHPGQMDWDHIDGNHKNNNTNNLQLLCANCHRLKTVLN